MLYRGAESRENASEYCSKPHLRYIPVRCRWLGLLPARRQHRHDYQQSAKLKIRNVMRRIAVSSVFLLFVDVFSKRPLCSCELCVLLFPTKRGGRDEFVEKGFLFLKTIARWHCFRGSSITSSILASPSSPPFSFCLSAWRR